MDTKTFLKTFNIWYLIQDNRIIVNGDLLLNGLNLMPEVSFNNCIINRDLSLNWLYNNCLNNCTIKGNLHLIGITYLPKNFNVNVEGEIFLDNLKSKTLKNLIKNPGASRQLAFNILNNL